MVRLLRTLMALSKVMREAGQVLRRHSFLYVLLATFALMLGGGALFTYVEGRELTLLDGIWWAVVTFSTVGYGDIYPETTAGRLLGALLIMVGVSVMALFMANVSSYLIRRDEGDESPKLSDQLDRLQEQLARLQAEQGRTQADLDRLLRLLGRGAPRRGQRLRSGRYRWIKGPAAK